MAQAQQRELQGETSLMLRKVATVATTEMLFLNSEVAASLMSEPLLSMEQGMC